MKHPKMRWMRRRRKKKNLEDNPSSTRRKKESRNINQGGANVSRRRSYSSRKGKGLKVVSERRGKAHSKNWFALVFIHPFDKTSALYASTG